MPKTIFGGLAAATMLAVAPAGAQSLQADQVVQLDTWNYDQLYTEGLSVDRLLDEGTVYGPGGEDIGSVENVLIGSDGRVLSIIAQVGGLWDIGDTHVNIPWEMVQISGYDRVQVPVTEDSVDDYSLYSEAVIGDLETGSVQQVDDDLETGPRVWRASELIGDYARLRDGDARANYGYVRDVIVRSGEVAAVVVDSDVGWGGDRGPYAYPYYGYGVGWNPGANYYDLPYDRNEVGTMQPFDYDRLGAAE